ncbi:MAG: DMT family transporter [Lachnospiraceae bacterium]|nr:DMT family transporter [Lachnospiraceae bacterium]
MKKKTTGYLFILLTTLIFSTMEVMLRYTRGLFAPMQITYLRFLIGGIALIPFAVSALKKHEAKLRGRDIAYFALTGFMCVAFSMVMYQMAILYTSASFVAVAFSANPVFVTILAALLLKEKIRPYHIIALVIEVAAIVVIVAPWKNAVDPKGVILTVAASLAFALYMVLGKKKTPAFGGIVVTCASILIGSLELLLILLIGWTAAGASFFEGLGLSIFANVPLLPALPKEAILPFLYICLINSAAGYVCHMLSLEMTSASETNLVYFLKPMLSPIIAFLFLKEVITANMWLGIALFLVGSAVAVLPGILALRKTQ